jgi:hypothetical protein
MVHHHLHHTVEASQWLKKAVRHIDSLGQTTGSTAGQSSVSWNDLLELKLLRHEAETLIRGSGQERGS